VGYHYGETPPERVPLALCKAAEVARKYVQDDLEIEFDVRWFTDLDAIDVRLREMEEQYQSILRTPLDLHGRRHFESPWALRGEVSGLRTFLFGNCVWIWDGQGPCDVLRVVAHEARHLWQMEADFGLRIKGMSPEKRREVEADADAYARKVAGHLGAQLEQALAGVNGK
jgi:hypothetical protein